VEATLSEECLRVALREYRYLFLDIKCQAEAKHDDQTTATYGGLETSISYSFIMYPKRILPSHTQTWLETQQSGTRAALSCSIPLRTRLYHHHKKEQRLKHGDCLRFDSLIVLATTCFVPWDPIYAYTLVSHSTDRSVMDLSLSVRKDKQRLIILRFIKIPIVLWL
jgi:hypothetical protein